MRPVGEIATAIEELDATLLSTLPGIGAATAERMIAKLRRRMPKFALLVAREAPDQAGPGADVLAEWELGRARGVVGSPHFFTPAGGFFCRPAPAQILFPRGSRRGGPKRGLLFLRITISRPRRD